jgi:hypothetical protein
MLKKTAHGTEHHSQEDIMPHRKIAQSAVKLFFMIAEPRVMRILLFGFYICLALYGLGILTHPPKGFEQVLDRTLVSVFASFMLGGGALALIAILPGIWFLERVGLICLTTAMLIYIVVVAALKLDPLNYCIPSAFIFAFALRWVWIRWAQLAPRKG